MAVMTVAILLRGVNLAGHNKVPMAELRRALADAGFGNVRTLLQSGNVVARTGARSAEAAARAVTSVVAERFGFPVPAVGLGEDQLRTILANCPLREVATDDSRLMGLVVSKPITEQMLATFDPRSVAGQDVALGSAVVYQWCPDGFHVAPQLLPRIERHWRVVATARNWRTLTRLHALMTPEAGRRERS